MTRYTVSFRDLILAILIYLVGNPAAVMGDDKKDKRPLPAPLPPSAIYAVPRNKPSGAAPEPEAAPQRPAGNTVTRNPAPSHGAPRTSRPSASSPQQAPANPPSQDAGPKARHNENGRTEQNTAQSYPTDRILNRRLGPEKVQRLLESIQAGNTEGTGSSNADWRFDGTHRRTGNDNDAHPAGTELFPTVTSGVYKRATVQDAKKEVATYGSYKGGVGLEDTATGLGEIDSVRYDSRFNAFILNDRLAYFVTVPPKTVAVLCRSISRDPKERIGVSLGDTQIVYGKLPGDSDLAWDLKLADLFLGNIVFAQKNGMEGYQFAGGFTPEASLDKTIDQAVNFKFSGFRFKIEEDEVQLAEAQFDVQLVPLSKTKAPDGGLLPDYDLIREGKVYPQYEANARHVAENISYYRRERIINRTFAYGEVAAFIRALKRAGFDLEALANHVPGG